ncbi:MAG: ArsC/Spx/MgsR family protein [Flavobacteriaceae bacterium]
MKKAYYLKTCDTCKKIIKSLPDTTGIIFQDIKENPVTVKQLEEMYALSGSYEKLFSKRAKLYKERNLKDENLSEKDFKQLILEHYTFLNRPVFILNQKIFIGNSPKTVQQLLSELS